MNAHIFNVDETTFPVHRDRGFCGTGKIDKPLRSYHQALDGGVTFSGIIADLKGTRPNDLVFFYEQHRGFHGVYQVVSPPFFDPQEIRGIGAFQQHTVGANLPFRVLIRCIDYFPEPVPEELIFSTPAYEQTFWIPFYRKIQGPRGCITIDPDATRALIELLIKVNGPPVDHEFLPFYYDSELIGLAIPQISVEAILQGTQTAGSLLQTLDLPLLSGQSVPLEDHLRGWLLSHLDDPSHQGLRRVFGPTSHLEWFANNVPYHVSRRNIDLLIYHRTPVGELVDPPLRYRYSVVELKRDVAQPEDIDQVMDYANWVAGRLANGEANIVRPHIIARRYRNGTIERARAAKFNRTGIRLIRYEVTGADQIALHEA